MTFADITLVPVRRDRHSVHAELSRRMAAVYRDHGALSVVDYWQAEDAADPTDFHASGAGYEPGSLQGLAGLAGVTDDEALVVTITEWPSREARDRGVVAATRDPRVTATLDEEPVFDGGRLLADVFERATNRTAND